MGERTTLRHCLETLCGTHAGKGFMLESFSQDDPSRLARSWFAWANAMFGELVLKVYARRPQLLSQTVSSFFPRFMRILSHTINRVGIVVSFGCKLPEGPV